ncbi:hypothetical protein IPG37_02085 [bacterium]|nr:MAG: hypothetical protein IPG37_02085 [bacterium]QQR62606.1 MAG: hypothetical protein IPH67_04285 [bacterium]
MNNKAADIKKQHALHGGGEPQNVERVKMETGENITEEEAKAKKKRQRDMKNVLKNKK